MGGMSETAKFTPFDGELTRENWLNRIFTKFFTHLPIIIPIPVLLQHPMIHVFFGRLYNCLFG